ncbi:transcobalamin-1-like isoform X2 [Hippopotamus amphibius kiboko]|uniref:transcobalamin-1-like isoform X2 n=1 Tax=Hippopotamus amphibius kiboko TaxID=575201 RepID=UPI0025996329|nr:transcobalamin-1-like isoform X2 [Hippopotamus amphibius kiboko]
MRPSHQLPLLGLLLFSLIPGQRCQICEVSKEDYSSLKPLVNTMVYSSYTKGIQDANILLTLRLVGIHNQSLEQQLTQQIKQDVRKRVSEVTSGQLALVILALGACKNPDEVFIRDAHLVSKLGEKFKAEIENMETHNGNPLTNYYQLSLTLLALCLFDGNYSIPDVTYYFTPENKNYYFDDQFSVDTGAMAVLALTCVNRSIESEKIKAGTEDSNKIHNYTKKLVEKILSMKTDGLFGNKFSTGEAMQALFVSSNYYKNKQNCQETLRTVLQEVSQGAFHLPIAAAQILPALMGKTYLDVNKNSSCTHSPVKFNISTEEAVTVTPTVSPANISVKYSVRINETLDSANITVKNGSVFLDVMKEAQKQNEAAFRFTAEDRPWGPYITSVQGIRANTDDRTYWKLLSDGQPLTQGAGSYVVKNGEYLEPSLYFFL